MEWGTVAILFWLSVMIFFAGYFIGMMAKVNNKMEDKSEEILKVIKELKNGK